MPASRCEPDWRAPRRLRGLAKTGLEHVFTAAALDLIRLDAWWAGTPLATTRVSHDEELSLGLAA